MNSEKTKPSWVIDVEMSLSLEEITALRRLADIEARTVEEVARDCMNIRCKELLNAYDGLPVHAL